jgi:phosphoglycerol transferase MdoB-like AlkP superfamily enzyme
MAAPQLPGYVGRLVMALMLSIGLNVTLLAVAFSIDPRRAELSRIERWSNFLLSPAAALTATLVPGHTGTQIVALALFSFVFYAALAWVAISLPAWWRTRL